MVTAVASRPGETGSPDGPNGRSLVPTREVEERQDVLWFRATGNCQSKMLKSRVAVEQAKGWIASRNRVDADAAFALLRNHARANRLPLIEVALAVTARRITLGTRHRTSDETTTRATELFPPPDGLAEGFKTAVDFPR